MISLTRGVAAPGDPPRRHAARPAPPRVPPPPPPAPFRTVPLPGTFLPAALTGGGGGRPPHRPPGCAPPLSGSAARGNARVRVGLRGTGKARGVAGRRRCSAGGHGGGWGCGGCVAAPPDPGNDPSLPLLCRGRGGAGGGSRPLCPLPQHRHSAGSRPRAGGTRQEWHLRVAPGTAGRGAGCAAGRAPPGPAVAAAFTATGGDPPVHTRERRPEVTPRPAGPDPHTTSRREPRTSLSTDAAPVLRPRRGARIPPRPPALVPRAARDPPRPAPLRIALRPHPALPYLGRRGAVSASDGAFPHRVPPRGPNWIRMAAGRGSQPRSPRGDPDSPLVAAAARGRPGPELGAPRSPSASAPRPSVGLEVTPGPRAGRGSRAGGQRPVRGVPGCSPRLPPAAPRKEPQPRGGGHARVHPRRPPPRSRPSGHGAAPPPLGKGTGPSPVAVR